MTWQQKGADRKCTAVEPCKSVIHDVDLPIYVPIDRMQVIGTYRLGVD